MTCSTWLVMQVWPFVHPGLAAAGLAAAALPVLIHFLNRRRFRKVPWAAMQLLLAANKRSVARTRIEQLLLLAIRTLIVLLLAFGLARPFLGGTSLFGLGTRSFHRVILVDNSCSTGAAVENGEPVFQSVHDALRRLVSNFPDGDAVSLITLAAPANAVVDQGIRDRRQVLDGVERIELSDAAADLPTGLQQALAILADSDAPPENRAVYIITDGRRVAWGAPVVPGAGDGEASRLVSPTSVKNPPAEASSSASDAFRRIAQQAEVFIIDLGLADPPNVAVTDMTCDAALAGEGISYTMGVDVTNFGRTTAAASTLEFRRDGELIRRDNLPVLEPGNTHHALLGVQIDEPGSHRVEARWIPQSADALAADNERFRALDVVDYYDVLLVDGKPGLGKVSGQTGYLATALAPGGADSGEGNLRVHVITDLELSTEPLNRYAVIALCNVRRLDAGLWERLTRAVEGGAGLAVFPGDLVLTEDYNRYGFAGGKGLLPAELGGVTRTQDESDQFFRFTPKGMAVDALGDFVGAEDTSLFLARTYAFIELTSVEQADGYVLLSYDNGSPAIVEKTYGQGRAMLFAGGSDMSWNNLPAKGDYVSLMLSAFRRLLPHRGSWRNVTAGAALREPLTSEQVSQRISIAGPFPTPGTIDIRSEDGAFAAVAPGTQHRGFYTLSVGDKQTEFAVNVDPAAADLTRLGEEGLRDLLDAPFTYIGGEAEWERSAGTTPAGGAADITLPILGTVVALLVMESLMAALMGRRR